MVRRGHSVHSHRGVVIWRYCRTLAVRSQPGDRSSTLVSCSKHKTGLDLSLASRGDTGHRLECDSHGGVLNETESESEIMFSTVVIITFVKHCRINWHSYESAQTGLSLLIKAFDKFLGKASDYDDGKKHIKPMAAILSG